MKRFTKNIAKAWVTSLIGVGTMVLTLVMVYRGTIDFVWNGLAGLSFGCILLLAPETIETKFLALLDRFTGKTGAAPTEPTNPNQAD